ncbi:guanitoxin biosynthesis L-enduracididine beta-hydroxylase GntD [Streptomyces sp. NBC_00503]|uniref:guanitoxin biosynthesis L-enduracididine beta-hydroxylase GntD n=1 Tax=Streptomyces sp. NBC_00503 TaxID=2903659 RepID=UPI002E802BFB|nr:guanitoxin biosynthesis L-enduracididine beta-hydroxylase GntD [Streptomyces sp. NBC_00503]WUD84119.1 TauD/TfdA family dioxygenase [Streptomyces sp. NBC_00503]
MPKLVLDPQELDEVNALARRTLDRYGTADDLDFLVDAAAIAAELPSSIHHFLNRFRREELGTCIIGGHEVDGAGIGPTPAHWDHGGDPRRTEVFDTRLVLYSAVIGEVFGWATQQNGRIIHDVLPIRGNEHKQLGSASKSVLEWHTEDAFHEHRPDFVVLGCLRNPDGAATTVADTVDLDLDPDDVKVLFEERFTIQPDESHLPASNTVQADEDFARIEAMLHRPEPLAVLFGDPERPYIRADRSFWAPVEGDDQAARALEAITEVMDGRLRDVTLEPGDYCFIDNHVVVHGRKPFTARYDGTDRWLKRVCVTRDLRTSRAVRSGLLSHVAH